LGFSDINSLALTILGALCFAILNKTPPRYLAHTTSIACVPRLIQGMIPGTWHPTLTTFVSSLTVACLAHLVARQTAKPAQTFLIPGVIYLLPGIAIYRAFALGLGKEIESATALGLSAMSTAWAISFGILLANWVVPSRRTL